MSIKILDKFSEGMVNYTRKPYVTASKGALWNLKSSDTDYVDLGTAGGDMLGIGIQEVIDDTAANRNAYWVNHVIGGLPSGDTRVFNQRQYLRLWYASGAQIATDMVVTSGTGAMSSGTTKDTQLSKDAEGKWRVAQSGDVVLGTFKEYIASVHYDKETDCPYVVNVGRQGVKA